MIRRRFERKLGNRPYRRRFFIAVEGEQTEPRYFEMFKSSDDCIVDVRCIPGTNQSAPRKVFQRLKKELDKEILRKNDEAWVVVDRDTWPEEQLDEICAWTKTDACRHFLAVSNPQFEFWLLLHFEDGKGIGAANCLDRLRKHLPDFKKNSRFVFSRQQLDDAILRAKRRDIPPCADWPRQPGKTTVYRLVEKLLECK